MIYKKSSENMSELEDGSVSLVVTSPPYPMIEMWDTLFNGFGCNDYDSMHNYLTKIWIECYRVLQKGRIMAINIGYATRKIDGNFKLFPNHSTIIQKCFSIGFTPLPYILWKKPTNKPNSFLGGGFYPPNAYVMQDCEFILLFRKGQKVPYKQREDSKYTFEERNKWFSQIWQIPGAKQNGYASFPEEIPYRLIRMFSCVGEKILDPFVGSGTTCNVADKNNRIGIGYEIK